MRESIRLGDAPSGRAARWSYRVSSFSEESLDRASQSEWRPHEVALPAVDPVSSHAELCSDLRMAETEFEPPPSEPLAEAGQRERLKIIRQPAATASEVKEALLGALDGGAPLQDPQGLLDPTEDPRVRPPAPGLPLADLLLVLPETGGELNLGEAKAPPNGP